MSIRDKITYILGTLVIAGGVVMTNVPARWPDQVPSVEPTPVITPIALEAAATPIVGGEALPTAAPSQPQPTPLSFSSVGFQGFTAQIAPASASYTFTPPTPTPACTPAPTAPNSSVVGPGPNYCP